MSKFNKALSSLIVSFLVTSYLPMATSQASAKAQIFKPSRAGRISTVISNTILNGVTPPKSSDGIAGDFYIDTKSMYFYGPKTKTHWPSPTSIRGPQGQSGSNGSNGSNGSDAKPGANAVSAGTQGLTGGTGPKGEQGVQGVQGAAGPSGTKGEAGSIGLAGSSGASGSIGVAGPTGAQGPAGPQGGSGNSGANGSVGPAGSNGSVGPTGSPGSVGATGPVGATGSAGPSNAIYGAISFASKIQGVIGTAQTSSNFGTFEAGKSYVVRIQIQTFNVEQLNPSYPLALTVSTQGASPSQSMSYVVANGRSFNLSAIRDEVSITAEVVLDGSQIATTYALTVTLICGANTTAFPVTLLGRYHAVVVGQVTQTS